MPTSSRPPRGTLSSLGESRNSVARNSVACNSGCMQRNRRRADVVACWSVAESGLPTGGTQFCSPMIHFVAASFVACCTQRCGVCGHFVYLAEMRTGTKKSSPGNE
ncbi:unnamed protein product [Lampetra fluviatilis]